MAADLELPPAVINFLHRMHSDPNQGLTYEIAGDGCSTSLNLTWVCLTCPGCQGARCPSNPATYPRPGQLSRARSWGGGVFSCSSQEDADEWPPTTPSACSIPLFSSSIAETGETTNYETTGGDDSDSSLTCVDRPFADLPWPVSMVGVSITENTNEDADEEHELARHDSSEHTTSTDYTDSDLDGHTAKSMDSGLCLVDRPNSHSSGPQSLLMRTQKKQPLSKPEMSFPKPDVSVRGQCARIDRSAQTQDKTRCMAKECHALWAALEENYIYYDDKARLLRVSELDAGEMVVKADRTEATLRAVGDECSNELQVVLEIVWQGQTVES